MRKNLLKTLLVAVGLVMGVNGTWADGVWSTIFTEDYNDATTFNKFWVSNNTDRYTINQTQRSGTDYAMEIAPVSNGNNGTTAVYKGLTSVNSTVETYQTADQFRITFEFNFCYNANQTAFFQIKNSTGAEVIGFYQTTANKNAGSLRLNANGSATEGTELGTFSLFNAGTTPTTYNTVVLYTENNGTYMDVTWAGQTEAKKYTISENEIIHFGEMVHNTKRYYNHFVFDNLKVELYSTQEIVAAPQAAITAINGVKRTVAITAQDNSHEIYYYLGDDSTNPIKYDKEFEVSESTTLHYYAQSTSGAKSEIQNMDIKCVEIQLVSPTAFRTGATSYRLSATQPETSGLTPTATIHYSLNGEEGTITDGGELTNVNDDIITWASAEGYKDSEKATIIHIAAYTTTEVWSYDLNSFPATYSTTSIANAIDTETETTLNDLTVYNLKNINKPNLFIENADGWLLRNQSSNAFKIQSAATTITFNNVTPQNVIYIKGVDDQGRYRISSIINGSVAYSYSNNEYFIVPNAEGAVTVTFNTGVSIYTVGVQALAQTVTVSEAGLATYCPTVGLDFTEAENIEAYKATIDADASTVTLTKVNTVAAGEGVLLRSIAGDAATENIPVAVDAQKNDGNDFVGVETDIESLATETDGYTNYILNNVDGVIGFYKAAGNSVAAGKAYLQVPTTAANAKSLKIVFGDTTGISEINNTAKADGAYYSISGVRVANPTKGLYIQNGKKVIVK